MINMTSTLIGRKCPVTGEIGLQDIRQTLSDHIILDSGSGLLMAHDYIDHVNGIKAIGTIEDELEAIGSAWASRGHYAGQITQQGMGYDLCECYRYFQKLKCPIPQTHQHILDEDFYEAIRLAKGTAETEFEDLDTSHWQLFSKLALSHMRTGVRKLYRKYHTTHPESQAFDNFMAIRDAVKETEILEGLHYKLRLREGQCTITEHYPA